MKTTYYSEFNNLKSISRPIIGSNSLFYYSGGLNFKKNKNGQSYLLRNGINNGKVVCDDAGPLLNSKKGKVIFDLQLPSNIEGGVLISNNNVEYLLFGINSGLQDISYPSIYAKFTSQGIKFGIWNKNGHFYIIDDESTIPKNQRFTIEFVWENEGLNDRVNFTMGIKINGKYSVLGDPSFVEENFCGIGLNLLSFNGKSNFQVGVYSLRIEAEKIYDCAQLEDSSSSGK